MDPSKSKSTKVLRKLTSPESKTPQLLTELTNYKSYLDPRRSSKLKTRQETRPADSGKKITHSNKSYLFNRTAIGTPYEKSAMLSYLSTPNEKSFNMDRLKMLRSDHAHRHDHLSTEDENGQDMLKVHLLLPEQKPLSKHYPLSAKLAVLLGDFDKTLAEWAEKSKQKVYGMVGWETIPFNYQLTETLNSPHEHTFASLAQQGIKELSITPCLLRRPISYESLEFADFEISKFLGSGGFSQVFLARCKLDHQFCALKFIRKDTITTAKKVKMLQNERNILFSVRHENLIDLLYAFQTKNYIVFGLEYCPLGNLYSCLQRVRSFTEGQAKGLMVQILNGLEYLHKNNILFRDIKLENILFDAQGKIKITDFGLSKPDIDEDEITYSYCGSPEYMAPEMLAKSGHSYQVDFYALGILLYELLFGRSPFYAPKKQDIFHAILHSEPKFPKTPPVSKEVKSLIKGLLAKNPNHRIGSLKGVRQILSHPWFRIQDMEAIAMDSCLYETKSSGKKQLQQSRAMFTSEQTQTKFQKMFFSQNFVNRTLYEKMAAKTRRFTREQRPSKPLGKTSVKRK